MAISGADAPRPVGPETRVTATGSARAADHERKEPRREAEARAREESRATGSVRLPEVRRHAVLFRHDPELNRIIIQVVDPETREIIRIIPAEEIVDALKVIRRTQGALLDEEA